MYTNSWHQGPDGWQPQYYLQRHLVGGAPLSLQIQHGRNGMFSAFELGVRYLRADPQRRVALLVAADNFGTPMVRRWRAGPGLILGDAASAVVLSKDRGFGRVLSMGTLALPDAEELHRAGEPMFPPGATTGRILDFRKRADQFQCARPTDPADCPLWPRVYSLLRDLVDQTLKEACLSAGEVRWAALTNVGSVETEQLLRAVLDFPLERSTWDFGRTVGQLGASDQIVSLERLLGSGQLRPGDHVLLVGVGQGITLSVTVVQIGHPSGGASRG